MNNFITDIIDKDLEKSNNQKNINTRFPPEPNGYLHIGHAKSIFLNFGIAEKYNGLCNLRFDDTNPTKENIDYVNSIINDVEWLGFKCRDNVLYASDYFDKMYQYALVLINKNLAYIDDQSLDEIKKNRGDYNNKGIESPYRNRTIDENLLLFDNMKNGLYQNGEKVLRAKIDMNAKNINLRDPVMYRILHASHHRTGNDWCIYPMYDWAHGIEDSIENISHSICTLEFEDHRPLYDWFLQKLSIHHPQQIEFARLNLEYTIMSKRHLKLLVDQCHVSNWDDPRMPTISGLRRRGYPANSIKEFIYSLGVAKNEGVASIEHLEHFVRKDLNKKSVRVMAVLDPVKLIIDNYDSEKTETLKAINNPEDSQSDNREIIFGKELYIEKDDFMENPPKKFFRLTIGKEVRLMHAYYVKCTHVKKDSNNKITEIHCIYDPKTKGGWSKDGRKVKGTIHWVHANKSLSARINVYNKLFNKVNPYDCNPGVEFTSNIDKDSFSQISNIKIKNYIFKKNMQYQFIRKGYYVLDSESSDKDLIFNQIVDLKDSWSKKHK